MQLGSTAGMVSRNTTGARKTEFLQTTWSTENNLLIGNQISCKEKDIGQSRKPTKTMHEISTLSNGCRYIKISHIFILKLTCRSAYTFPSKLSADDHRSQYHLL
uniref:Uncharacterized protein n=1 Tax=Micrurus corallinus TaxID=54390 RepID=A0A2D4FFY1_MICCO